MVYGQRGSRCLFTTTWRASPPIQRAFPLLLKPGGYDQTRVHQTARLTRIYYSAYPTEWLAPISRYDWQKKRRGGISTWCIFDNTALGAATADALR